MRRDVVRQVSGVETVRGLEEIDGESEYAVSDMELLGLRSLPVTELLSERHHTFFALHTRAQLHATCEPLAGLAHS
jgi:hypothetical protein